MRKFLRFLVLIILLIFNRIYIVNAAANAPTVSADSVVLMDANTGTMLYSKNPEAAYPPASTTKTMTALLTFENTSLTDEVTVGRNPTFAEGSAVGLKEGEIVTVKDLLHGLLLESGNDCAVALAEHISGSTEKFAQLMNERARALGCTSTNFVNPSGLYDDNHKTSAKDLALIMQELIKYPDYKTISTTPFYKIGPTNKTPEDRYANNKNRLVLKRYSTYYQDCIGGKTGYTVQSKHSYVAAAHRNGQTLIVSLVHDSAKTYFEDAANLFEYGFSNFELKKLFSEGDQVSSFNIDAETSIPLLASRDYYYVQEKNNNELPNISVIQPSINNTSISRGQRITEASVTFKNLSLTKIDLTSGADYDYKPISSKLAEGTSYASSKLNYIIYSFIAISIIVLSLIITTRKLKKTNKTKRYNEMKLNRRSKDI